MGGSLEISRQRGAAFNLKGGARASWKRLDGSAKISRQSLQVTGDQFAGVLPPRWSGRQMPAIRGRPVGCWPSS